MGFSADVGRRQHINVFRQGSDVCNRLRLEQAGVNFAQNQVRLGDPKPWCVCITMLLTCTLEAISFSFSPPPTYTPPPKSQYAPSGVSLCQINRIRFVACFEKL